MSWRFLILLLSLFDLFGVVVIVKLYVVMIWKLPIELILQIFLHPFVLFLPDFLLLFIQPHLSLVLPLNLPYLHGLFVDLVCLHLLIELHPDLGQLILHQDLLLYQLCSFLLLHRVVHVELGALKLAGREHRVILG